MSHETLQVPAPHGSRCRTPVDENQSLTSTPRSPSRKFDGGVTLLERPSTVENIGTNAPLALAHPRRLDFCVEPHDRQIGIVFDRAPNGVLEREVKRLCGWRDLRRRRGCEQQGEREPP